jgi:hypothetical protein
MISSINSDEILEIISETENLLQDELLRFWELIKIQPEKWSEEKYGKETDGFWVVGIYGKNVVWYNEIEEGFNISNYNNYGTIAKCTFEQYTLNQIIYQLYNSLLY